jgi:hypothetical protein
VKVRFSTTALLALVMAFTIAACGGSSVVIPSIPVGGVGGPTLAPGQTAAAGTSCASYPTLNLAASAQPTIPVDSTLLSSYPQQVGDQPITEAEANPFLGLMCYSLGQAAVDQMGQSTSVLGINLATMSFGSFQATIADNTIKVSAIRTPGQDATKLIAQFGLLGSFVGLSVTTTGLADANVGGKNVKVVTDTDGSKSYFYAHGDTLWTFENASDAEATAILSALP